MRFKSLQTKYLALISVALVAVVVAISAMCIVSYSQTLEQVAASRMNLVTQTFAKEINNERVDVAETTQTLADYVAGELESPEKLANDEAYRAAYLADIDEFSQVVMGTEDVISSYFVRFDVETLGGLGFRYRRNDQGDFRPAQTTRLSDYDPDDFENVGWYYEPIRAGVAVWMEPYFDAAQNRYKITYVIPVYRDGKLLAVVGSDIVFQSLVDSVDALGIMPDATAFLCDENAEMYYHEGVDLGTGAQRAVDFEGSEKLDGSSKGAIFDGVLGDERVKYSYENLFGDVYLVETRPVSGIFQSRDELLVNVLIVSALLVAIGIAVAYLVSRSIVRPLRKLDSAASTVMHDDALFEIEPRGNDEVATLTRSFQTVARELKKSLEHLNDLAYRDGMTGVRNKRGYDIEALALDQDVAEGIAEFGVAVFDVNGLKQMNDEHGHEAGNDMIKTACNRICECFKHSPVFRIGGDEFAVILKGSDLENAEKRIEHFEKLSFAENAIADEEWQVVHVAIGAAQFDPKRDKCVADVFERADAKMYRVKAEMKGAGNVR